MIEIIKLFFLKSRLIFFFFKSRLWGAIKQGRYKKAKCFCLFIGYPRTGHSLVSALLDAHPNVVMSMEWNVLHFLEKRYKKNQIFWSIERNSKKFKEKCKNIWTGYNYNVEGQFQGQSEEILIIGDKMAGVTSGTVIHNPLILEKLEQTIQLKVKLIHTIRNPYDSITTMAIRILQKKYPTATPTYLNLLPMIKRFFEYATLIQNLKIEGKFEIIDLYHENIILNPKFELRRLIQFLEISADEKYYSDCSKIIYNEPNKSRYNIEWPNEIKTVVESEIKKIDFLSHYRFDN